MKTYKVKAYKENGEYYGTLYVDLKNTSLEEVSYVLCVECGFANMRMEILEVVTPDIITEEYLERLQKDEIEISRLQFEEIVKNASFIETFYLIQHTSAFFPITWAVWARGKRYVIHTFQKYYNSHAA